MNENALTRRERESFKGEQSGSMFDINEQSQTERTQRIMSMMDLKNRVAIVTGGSKGIGAATAGALAAAGAKVMIAARKVEPRTAAATGLAAMACDVSDPQACAALVKETMAKLGPVEVLVHCAGGPSKGRIGDCTEEDWQMAWRTHVDSTFHLVRAALPGMKQKGGGSVVLVGSVAGVRGIKGAFSYGVAKGAVEQMTRMLAMQLADDRIRVNAVSPGIIRTDFHAGMSEEVRKNNIDNRIPLHREGSPEDVAAAVCFLIQHEYLTGVSLPVDGGLWARNA